VVVYFQSLFVFQDALSIAQRIPPMCTTSQTSVSVGAMASLEPFPVGDTQLPKTN